MADSEGGQLMGKVVVTRGLGANQPSPSSLPLQPLGPSGASLRLPVRLMEWMDGVGERQMRPEVWQTGVHKNTSTATSLAAEHEAESAPAQREEKGHLGVGA